LDDHASHIVLDTDVASRLLTDRLAGSLLPVVVGRDWCVTFVTVGELWKWAIQRRWGPRARGRLERWLRAVVILPYNERVARRWGEIAGYAALRGRPRPANDSWIAACCLVDGLPLVTGNVKDLVDFAEHEGLRLVGRT
jgi:predicted nucleic acid-binding protein